MGLEIQGPTALQAALEHPLTLYGQVFEGRVEPEKLFTTAERRTAFDQAVRLTLIQLAPPFAACLGDDSTAWSDPVVTDAQRARLDDFADQVAFFFIP